MIKALSPYYIETPWLSPLTGEQATSYTINLYVWSGDKTTIPAEPQYSLTKQNIGQSVGTDNMNISRLVNDFLVFTPVIITGLNGTENQKWVHKNIVYTTTDPTDEGVQQLPETYLASKGYTYGNEGKNAQPPADNIWLNSRDFKADKKSIFSIPFRIDGNPIIVKSHPNGELDYTIETNTINTDISSNVIQVLNLDLLAVPTDKFILVDYGASTIYIELHEEHKYTPVNIIFLNKEGEQQTVIFFKERRDSMSITKQTYENDRAQPSTGAHQYVDLNVQARSKFDLSSGFVNETQNQAFKELSLSTDVYEYNGGELLPVNVSKKAIEYKTRVNEKLINYTFNFEYSYNEINNI